MRNIIFGRVGDGGGGILSGNKFVNPVILKDRDLNSHSLTQRKYMK